MATKKGSKDQEPKVEAKKGGLASKRPINSTFGETVLEVAPLQQVPVVTKRSKSFINLVFQHISFFFYNSFMPLFHRASH